MGPATGLHGRHLAGRFQVRQVEDAHPAEALHADAVLHPLGAAVEASAGFLRGHEQQVAVDGHVALAAGTHDRDVQLDVAGVGDVVDLEAVVVALEEVIPLECEVRVGETRPLARRLGVEEALRTWRGRHQLQVPDGALGVQPARGQVHARVQDVPVEGGKRGLGERVGAHLGEFLGPRLTGRHGLSGRVRRQRQRGKDDAHPQRAHPHRSSIDLKPLLHRPPSPFRFRARPKSGDADVNDVSRRSPAARACAGSPSPGPPPHPTRNGRWRIPVPRPGSRTKPRP